MNWSNAKKAFVTAQLCILTTTIYLSAAIYTAGIQGVQQQFQVSEVAALLGLTLFVAGYGLGPMVWVRVVRAFRLDLFQVVRNRLN